MSAAPTSTFSISSSNFLRRILMLDAATCLLMGLLFIALAQSLGALFGLPSNLLFYAGLLLLPCSALMLISGLQTPPNAILVWLVILGNLAWLAASILVITVWFSPNSFGIAFVLFQAAVVAVLAFLEYRGLKKN